MFPAWEACVLTKMLKTAPSSDLSLNWSWSGIDPYAKKNNNKYRGQVSLCNHEQQKPANSWADDKEDEEKELRYLNIYDPSSFACIELSPNTSLSVYFSSHVPYLTKDQRATGMSNFLHDSHQHRIMTNVNLEWRRGLMNFDITVHTEVTL